MENKKTYQDMGDPDDWPKEWITIRDIDTLLRCSICCEYMDTPMTLSKCSHSYCSLCIRRSICYKAQCPTCFMATTEGDMVNNRTLGEIIQKFSSVRKRLLAVLCGNNNHIEDVVSTPSANSIKSTPDQRRIKCLFVKSKSPLSKSPTGDCSKVSTAQKKKDYGLRAGHDKKYIQSDDSDTINNDSDSDVIICGDAEAESSDEDFQPVTPSTNRKKKNATKRFHSTSKKYSSHTTGSLDTSRSSSSRPEGVSPQSTTKSVEPVEANDMLESGDKLVLSSYQSPLRLPSLNPANSLQTSTPVHSQVPSCSTAVQGGSAEKAGHSIVRVPCPVCGVEVSNKHINLHLDRCLKNKVRPAEPRPTPTRRKQMPKLVYNLLNDKDLKKKCAQLGLNNQGDRKTLIKRHHEFTLLYNSQCDAANPMTAAEIIREVEKTEKAKTKGLQTKINTANKLVIQKGSSADQVEAAQKEYAKQHKSQFDLLIEEARKRRMKKQAEKAAAAGAPEKTKETDPPATMLPSDTTENESLVTDTKVTEPLVSTPLVEADCPVLVPAPQPSYPKLTISTPQISPPTNAVPMTTASSSKCKSETVSESTTENVAAVSEAAGQWNDDLETQFLEDDSSDFLLAQQPEVNSDIAQSAPSASTVAESHYNMDKAEDVLPMDKAEDVAENDCGDETLPLEDSQLDVSDDDMFDSPGSPSLLVDAHQSYTQNSFLTSHEQGEDHTDGKTTGPTTATVVPIQFDFAPRIPVEARADPIVDEQASIANQQIGVSEFEDRDLVGATKTEKRKRGRPKKDTKTKVQASQIQNEAVEGPSSTAPVSDAAEVQLGWPDIEGYGDGEHREDAASETLSEPASGVSTLSHTDSSIGDYNIPSWSRDVDLDADFAQPRRSSRARNKRKLSDDSSETVAVGKRTRRPELSKDTDGHVEIPATDESEHKGQRERRRQGRRK